MRDFTGVENFSLSGSEAPDPLARLNGPKRVLQGLAGNACAHSLLVSTGAGGRKEYAVHDDQHERIIRPDGKSMKASPANLAGFTVLQSYQPHERINLSGGRVVEHFHGSFGNHDGSMSWTTPAGEDWTWNNHGAGKQLPGVPIKNI